MKLSIIMPAYNERKTLREIVGRVLAVDIGSLEKELVIVDDGSTDGTRDILRELDGRDGIRAVFQPCNLGKGAAVWAGLRASTGSEEPISSRTRGALWPATLATRSSMRPR